MAHILVTGSSGQVGVALQSVAAASQHRFTFLSRAQLDISDQCQVSECVRDTRPDVIINAAAYTEVDKAEEESQAAFAANAEGPANLACAANKIEAALLHLSTDYVFSGAGNVPWSETDSPAPASVYGQTKLKGELEIERLCQRYLIVRTAWLFGAGKNFVRTVLRLGVDRHSIDVVADQFGCPTSADDLAAALLQIVDHIASGKLVHWGVYHFAGSPATSWYKFADYIFEQAFEQGVLDHRVEVRAITSADYPTRAPRPANSRLNCDKIAAEFAIAPSDWRLALQDMARYQ